MEPLEKPFQPKGRSKLSLVHKTASRDQTKKIRKQTLPAMRVAYWGSRHRDDDKRESEDDTTKSGNIDLMAARLMGMSRMSRQQVYDTAHPIVFTPVHNAHYMTYKYTFRSKIF